MAANELSGSFWPNERQRLLLHAALSGGERSAAAWRELRPRFDLDDPEPSAQPLLPLVYRRLDGLGIEDPGLPKLRGIYRRTWYMNQLLLDRLKGALELVREIDGDPLVVSSWELPIRYYSDLGLRAVAALHLLVRPERVARVARALSGTGWKGPPEPSESFIRSRHNARYERADGGVCVLYWRLFHEFSDPRRGVEAKDLWEPAIEFDLGGVSARALSPTDELLNVCVSGARMSNWPSITWVADALAVLRAPDAAIDWERLVLQARALRATLRVHDAASFLARELAADVPENVLEALRDTALHPREVLAHRAAGKRLPAFGHTPDTLTRFLRLTANASLVRALASLPAFLRDEWGLERRSQVPLAAARKGVEKVGAARAGRRTHGGRRSRPSCPATG